MTEHNLNEDRWERMFLELVDFKAKYGQAWVKRVNTNTKERSSDNDNKSDNNKTDNFNKKYQVLMEWCRTQRSWYRQGKMAPARIKRLEAMGFEWEGKHRGSWDDRFQELKAFKAAHGHTKVRTGGRLGFWVSKQRASYSKGTLPEERMQLLESIDFVWRINAERCKSSYQYNTEKFQSKRARHARQVQPENTFTISTSKDVKKLLSDLTMESPFGDQVRKAVKDFSKDPTKKKQWQTCLQFVCSTKQKVDEWKRILENAQLELIKLVENSAEEEDESDDSDADGNSNNAAKKDVGDNANNTSPMFPLGPGPFGGPQFFGFSPPPPHMMFHGLPPYPLPQSPAGFFPPGIMPFPPSGPPPTVGQACFAVSKRKPTTNVPFVQTPPVIVQEVPPSAAPTPPNDVQAPSNTIQALPSTGQTPPSIDQTPDAVPSNDVIDELSVVQVQPPNAAQTPPNDVQAPPNTIQALPSTTGQTLPSIDQTPNDVPPNDVIDE